MLVNEVKATLLRRRAEFLTSFNKASIRLLTFRLTCFSEGIMVLVDVQGQEMRAREVSGAF